MLEAMEITTMTQVMQLHAQLLKSGDLGSQTENLGKLFTFSALSPNGNLTYARNILDTLKTPDSYYWSTMIRAYSQSPDPNQALTLFLSMHRHLHSPITAIADKFTYPFLLKSCTRLKQSHAGKQLHGLIYKSDLDSDPYIRHSLIHMYSGCGQSCHAYKVFEKMSDKDVVSWTSMIDGLVDDQRPIEAIKLFEEMMEEGVEPNEATIVAVLRACADTGALSMGRRVHGVVKERKHGWKANVSTALIDMYSKCGCIDSAKRVFDEIVEKDVFSWTAMISSLASHGRCRDAIDLFEQRKSFNVKPDERTMTAVLSACRNAGWVNNGYSYFKRMRKWYGVKPTIQHYGCVVDLFARAGCLDEAEEFIKMMPIEPDAILWRTLVWACKVQGDIERSERLMKYLPLQELESTDCGNHVLLGNVYASAGKWDDKARVRELMNEKGLVKPPGASKIEIDGVIHEFAAGDSGHLEAAKIYEKLDVIKERLREEGYFPKLSEVLLEIDDEEKASQLLHHSEKLAVAFGLIKTSAEAEIRIVKNLRSCEDCHTVMKLISKVYQRKILVRDRIRFHYFRNGNCSCGDYW